MPLTRRSALASFAGLSAGLAMPALAQTAAKPPVTGRIRHLAYSDPAGRPDGVQAMVSRKHLYIGHIFANGFTVMDVADPRQPKPLQFVAAPPIRRCRCRAARWPRSSTNRAASAAPRD